MAQNDYYDVLGVKKDAKKDEKKSYDEVITRHDIAAFGFYWWGEKELVTLLRAQAAIAVSHSLLA